MFNKKLKNRIKELEHDRDVLWGKVGYLMECRDSRLGDIKRKRSGNGTYLYLDSLDMGHIRGWEYIKYFEPERPNCLPKEVDSWEEYDYLISQIKLYTPYLYQKGINYANTKRQ